MDISNFPSTLASPPPGSAAPGNLYADLQSRTLWLGVSTSVDPAGAVLVSDMIALMEQMDETLLEAKTYTDTQITTRAPTVHTHTSGQITDFNGAVTSVVLGIPGFNWVRGMIMLYSGSMADIGAGGLAGWALCDGSNGTPDLRDRMILGAGNKVPGTKNSQASLTTDLAGAFTPIIQGTALTVSQMPSHAHTQYGTFNTGYVSSDHTHAVSIWSGWAGNHAHTVTPVATSYVGQAEWRSGGANIYYPGTLTTNYPGDHQHAVNGNTGGISANHYHAVTIGGATYANGGDAAHTHGANAVPGHGHVISSNTLRETMPYYALAFIMKL
jgi:hypothetical protein